MGSSTCVPACCVVKWRMRLKNRGEAPLGALAAPVVSIPVRRLKRTRWRVSRVTQRCRRNSGLGSCNACTCTRDQ